LVLKSSSTLVLLAELPEVFQAELKVAVLVMIENILPH
jgi:hypothetical protein